MTDTSPKTTPDKPIIKPWICPRCGRDCSGLSSSVKDYDESVRHRMDCPACGCEFYHYESITYAPMCVEVDGVEYEYPAERPGLLAAAEQALACIVLNLEDLEPSDVDAVNALKWAVRDARIRHRAADLFRAAERVIGNWETGDLAAAIRELDAVVKSIRG